MSTLTGARSGKAVRRVAAIPTILPWALCTAAIAFLPELGVTVDWTSLITMACFIVMLVSSLSLSMGYAGQLALGQVALYAAGAYTSGYIGLRYTHELLLLIPVAIVAAVVLAGIVTACTVRLGGWTLAIASFFIVVVIPDVVNEFPNQLGGPIGLSGLPVATLAGSSLSPNAYYVVVVVTTFAWMLAFRNLAKSSYGVSFLVLRESPVLASSLGLSPYGVRLRALLVAAIPAGCAGALYAFTDGVVVSSTFSLTLTTTVLAACILGGPRSIYGVFFGAAAVQLADTKLAWLQNNEQTVFGVFLIACGIFLPDGAAGIVRPLLRVLGRRRTGGGTASLAAITDLTKGRSNRLVADEGSLGQTLRATDVRKSFGGVEALRGVTITANPGQVTALIGPNGSGKTTMLNIMSGLVQPDSGQIRVGDQDTAGMKPHMIARLGVSRTFQTPLIPHGLDAVETAAAARAARVQLWMAEAMLRLPRFNSHRRNSVDLARRALQDVGLSPNLVGAAQSLPLGTRRLVELARAIVGATAVILLDEIASGLDEQELDHLDSVLRQLASQGATIVLVEHNMHVIKRIADVVYVLAQGRLIASGQPDEVLKNEAVRKVYLGTDHVVERAVTERS